MKRCILAIAGLGTAIGIGFYVNRARTLAISGAENTGESSNAQAMELPHRTTALAASPTQITAGPGGTNALARSDVVVAGQESRQAALAAIPRMDSRLVFDRDIETLVSSQAGFEQKQAIWKGLKSAGKLDQAISELELRAANDPRTAEYPAALGQAYLKKCIGMEDLREQAVLAMKADQSFETALNLDPSNWEARFTKAVGMSYWPRQLNKGEEVIEQFRTLIQQQEAQPPQPQFARSYVWLGDQYQKAGHSEDAAQVWQRGATLFPNNKELTGRLTSAQERR
jgi:tetratricopeptide (TPR) repeat protein